MPQIVHLLEEQLYDANVLLWGCLCQFAEHREVEGRRQHASMHLSTVDELLEHFEKLGRLRCVDGYWYEEVTDASV